MDEKKFEEIQYYSYKQIHDAVEKEEEKKPCWGGSTGLVDVIYSGTIGMFEDENS